MISLGWRLSLRTCEIERTHSWWRWRFLKRKTILCARYNARWRGGAIVWICREPSQKIPISFTLIEIRKRFESFGHCSHVVRYVWREYSIGRDPNLGLKRLEIMRMHSVITYFDALRYLFTETWIFLHLSTYIISFYVQIHRQLLR